MNRVIQPLLWLAVFTLCVFTSSAQQVVTDVATAVPAQSTVALPSDPIAPLSQWAKLAAMTDGRGYIDGAYLNGALYAFGGITSQGSITNTAYKYDITANTWSALATMPTPRSLPMVRTVNNKVYIVGGYSTGSPFTTEGSVLIYDPATNAYTTGATMPKPAFGGGAFVLDGRIWILGGGSIGFNVATDSVQIYDPATDTWVLSTSKLPLGIRAMGVAQAGTNTVYMVGGYNVVSGQGTFYASVYKGVIAGDAITWTKIADFPGGPIMRLMAGSNGAKMFITGGYDVSTNQTGNPSAKTWEIDPATDTWKQLELKPTGVLYASSMIYDGTGKFYVIGGTTASAYIPDLEVFNPNEALVAKITVSKTAVNEWAKRGAMQRVPFVIRSQGGADLTWTASSAEPWLSLSKMSGSIKPAEFDQLLLQIDGANLQNGTSSGTLTIASNDPLTPSLNVAVTVKVQDQDVDEDVNVLLEEGTGTWCGYCPYGVDSINAVLAQFPGRVNVISYHGGSATEPLQTPSTNFWANLSGLTGFPNGSVQRIVFEGETAMALGRGDWGKRTREVLNTRRSPISISLTSSSYDAQTKGTMMTVEVLFHRDINVPLSLNIAQLQDKQVYTQVFYAPNGTTQRLTNFQHNHTMRKAIPNDKGELLQTGTPNFTSQTRISKTFNFVSVDSTIGTSRFIIYVHQSNGTTYGEVLQSIEVPLSDIVTDVKTVPTETAFALEQNYPNPFNPSTMISYNVATTSHVQIIISDAMGREVARLVDGVEDAGSHKIQFNASGLPTGSYFMTMRAGNFTQTRTMTLVK